MFTVVFAVFSAMVIFALVSGAFYLAMRIRLMRADTARDRIEWLSLRGGDDVLDTYEALFFHLTLGSLSLFRNASSCCACHNQKDCTFFK